ncbi:hypothetical protein QBC34DRAFT_300863 [Podospora aff. communis PSN243]|uniref:MaoC-like domain-containing protein n=1 Tax=Podospora aff. communis PSN243 TaxID=3040156 RepID=A0AAV9GKU8_9PEZI|nr:hypothetical protein QBC34DRAFT_300863 [Podospora aff. communis PSN243]
MAPKPPKPVMTPELQQYIERAEHRMSLRKPKLLFDTISPMNSHLLDLALADHLPPDPMFDKKKASARWTSLQDYGPIPDGHHLLYFPIQATKSGLMRDGTDPDHSPGAPFVRRMWAGGAIQFHKPINFPEPHKFLRGWCLETVGEPRLKLGREEGDEKVFVTVQRQYGIGPTGTISRLSLKNLQTDFKPRITETRKLVFMRERGPEDVKAGPAKIIHSTQTPDYSFTLTPDPKLLFQFSALTYNAHAIHLDPDYARNKEGYPERLVHGPLTLILMLTALRQLLDTPGQKYVLRTVHYQNISPLFVNQPLKVCVRQLPNEGQYGIWVEGPGGSLCAKGTATAVTLATLYNDAPKLEWLQERQAKGVAGIPLSALRGMDGIEDTWLGPILQKENSLDFERETPEAEKIEEKSRGRGGGRGGTDEGVSSRHQIDLYHD